MNLREKLIRTKRLRPGPHHPPGDPGPLIRDGAPWPTLRMLGNERLDGSDPYRPERRHHDPAQDLAALENRRR
jgi:hypothetical protein